MELKQKWALLRYRKELKKREDSLRKFFNINFDPMHTVGKANHEYLIHHIAQQTDLYCALKKPKKLKSRLEEKLLALDHTYRDQSDEEINYPYDEKAENIRRTIPTQYTRIYLALKALEDQGLCERIGELIESDLKDKCNEHGGIVLTNGKSLTFRELPSEYACRHDPCHHHTYKWPIFTQRTPHIFQYHQHASREDSSRDAGPSQGKWSVTAGDMSACHTGIVKNKECHNLVITKIPGKRFNVDYYGGAFIWNELKIDVIDLGNYSYDQNQNHHQGQG